MTIYHCGIQDYRDQLQEFSVIDKHEYKFFHTIFTIQNYHTIGMISLTVISDF